MKKVIIFGLEQFSELLYEYLQDHSDYEVCAFTVDQAYCDRKTFFDLPVIPFEVIEQDYPATQFEMFIALGYNKMNLVRQKKFKEAKAKGYKIASYTHPSATVLSSQFGEGNIIFESVTIGAKCQIGDGNVFWANAHVAHHTTVQNFNFFTISVAVAGNIKIGNNCFFGNNCTVRNGINIADFTLVGAGSYIDKSTNLYGVYVPARSIQLVDRKSTDVDLSSSTQ